MKIRIDWSASSIDRSWYIFGAAHTRFASRRHKSRNPVILFQYPLVCLDRNLATSLVSARFVWGQRCAGCCGNWPLSWWSRFWCSSLRRSRSCVRLRRLQAIRWQAWRSARASAILTPGREAADLLSPILTECAARFARLRIPSRRLRLRFLRMSPSRAPGSAWRGSNPHLPFGRRMRHRRRPHAVLPPSPDRFAPPLWRNVQGARSRLSRPSGIGLMEFRRHRPGAFALASSALMCGAISSARAEPAQQLASMGLDSSIPCRLDQPLGLAGQGLKILQGQSPKGGSRCFSVINHWASLSCRASRNLTMRWRGTIAELRLICKETVKDCRRVI